MPPLKRPLPDEPDDIWRQHQAEIRELYQEERRTLEDVKSTMEERGFPEYP